MLLCWKLAFIFFFFVLRPTTGQVRHKVFIKVGLDAGPQPTRVRQKPKIPSASSTFPQKKAPQAPGNNQQKQLVFSSWKLVRSDDFIALSEKFSRKERGT